MVLDTTTFLIVFAIAVVAMGAVIGVRYRMEQKKNR
jgi:hypothetical protein